MQTAAILCDIEGFKSNDFDSLNELIRMNTYRKLGYTEKAFDDEMSFIRFEAYNSIGYTKKALADEQQYIIEEAEKYFEKCKEVLDLHEVKYVFNKEEAFLLEMNQIKVNESIVM